MLLHLPLQFEGLGKDIKSIYMEELGEVVPFFYILPTITKIFICESSVSVERDETTTGIHQQVNFIKPENIGKLGNGELDQHRQEHLLGGQVMRNQIFGELTHL
eukprot:TRINITY_DN11234_c0_g1_i7.p2 TRINITY_DN11234_c0_g1~~TRINITY_DN11234_c0_g1_i7.p2  ORF type:complete len:104 (-),score=22.17 TRINITY_DN11234_c0_g1_i7:2060-2371(-)